jgi:hypothetical protein
VRVVERSLNVVGQQAGPQGGTALLLIDLAERMGEWVQHAQQGVDGRVLPTCSHLGILYGTASYSRIRQPPGRDGFKDLTKA